MAGYVDDPNDPGYQQSALASAPPPEPITQDVAGNYGSYVPPSAPQPQRPQALAGAYRGYQSPIGQPIPTIYEPGDTPPPIPPVNYRVGGEAVPGSPGGPMGLPTPVAPPSALKAIGNALLGGTLGTATGVAPALVKGAVLAFTGDAYDSYVNTPNTNTRALLDKLYTWDNQVKENFGPEVKQVQDVNSFGTGLIYIGERLIRAGPVVAAAIAAPEGAAPVIFGAIQGLTNMDQANVETNGDPKAMAVGLISGIIEGGATLHLMNKVTGPSFAKNIAGLGSLQAAVGAGQQLTEMNYKQIAAAHNVQDFIDTMDGPTWPQFVNGIVENSMMGGVFGAIGTPGGKRRAAAAAADGGTGDATNPKPMDPAASAALNVALNPNGPVTDPARLLAGPPGSIVPNAPVVDPAVAEARARMAQPGGPSVVDPNLQRPPPGTPAAAAGADLAAQAGLRPPVPPTVSPPITDPNLQRPPPGTPAAAAGADLAAQAGAGRPVPGPVDVAAIRQAATIEQARRNQGDVIPGAPGEAPPERMPLPAPAPAAPVPVAGELPPPSLTNRPPVPPIITAPDQSLRPIRGSEQLQVTQPPETPTPPAPGLPALPAPSAANRPAVIEAPDQSLRPIREGQPLRPVEPTAAAPAPQLSLQEKLADKANWRFEKDDATPGQTVLKHGDDVLAVGGSPKEAMELATLRAQRSAEATKTKPVEPKVVEVPTVGKEAEAAPEPKKTKGQLLKEANAEKKAKAAADKKAADEEAAAAAAPPPEKPKSKGQLLKEANAAKKLAAAEKKAAEERAAVAKPTPGKLVATPSARAALRKRADLEAEGRLEPLPEPKEADEDLAEGAKADAEKLTKSTMFDEGEGFEDRKAPPPRVVTTDMPREYEKALEEDLMDNSKPVAEANKRFEGIELRKNDNFIQWLVKRIAGATPEEINKEKLASIELDEDGNKTEAAREADDRLQKLEWLQHNALRLHDEIIDMKVAEQNKAIENLNAIANAAAALKQPKTRADVQPVQPEYRLRQRFRQAVGRIDAGINRLLGRDQPFSVHEALDQITGNRALDTAGLSRTRALAQTLRRILPRDLRVMNEETAQRLGLPGLGDDAHAAYFPEHNAIIIRGSSDITRVEALLHEGVHGATGYHIDRMQERVARGTASPEDINTLDMLRAIQKETVRALDGMGEHGYADTFRDDLHETASHLLTDPALHDMLAREAPSAAFVSEMRQLGFEAPKPTLRAAFTNFVRRVLGLPPNTTDRMLDHIMRPLESLVEKSEPRYVDTIRRNLSGSPELRGVATQVFYRSAEARPMTERARDVLFERYGRTKSALGDWIESAALKSAPLDQMVNWTKGVFDVAAEGNLPAVNHLVDHVRAVEGVGAVTRAEAKLYRDKLFSLKDDIKALRRSGDIEGLAKLVNDVGYGNAKLGSADPAANAHLTSEAQRSTLADLEQRYASASRPVRDTYNKLRDLYEELHNKERVATLDNIIETALPGTTAAQNAALRGNLGSKPAIERFLRGVDKEGNLLENVDPRVQELAAAYGEQWNHNRKIIRMMGEYYHRGFVQGDYFPLRRYGDHIVTWGDKGTPSYGLSMYESKYDARRALQDLKDRNIEGNMYLKSDRYLGSKITPDMITRLGDALTRGGMSDAQIDHVRDVFTSMYLKAANSTEARRMAPRRQGIRGASEDLSRILNQEFTAYTHRMGFLKGGAERAATLDALRVHTELLERGDDADKAYLARKVTSQMYDRRPNLDESTGLTVGASKVVTNLGFMSTLMRPARVFIDQAGFHAMNQALLGGEYGQIAAAKALARATHQVGFGLGMGGKNFMDQARGRARDVKWNVGDYVAEGFKRAGEDHEFIDMLKEELQHSGHIDVTFDNMMHEMAQPGGMSEMLRTAYDRSIGAVQVFDHSIEVTSRFVAAKAAAELELAKLRSNSSEAKRAAVLKAVEHLRNATPNWNAPNMAYILQAGNPVLRALTRPVFQFRNYALHSYALYGNLIRNAMRNETEGARAVAVKQLVGLVATHALLAGVSVPVIQDGANLLMGIAGIVSGDKTPFDWERHVANWLSDMGGPAFSQAVLHGLPTLAGIDISGSLTLANQLMFPEYKDLNPNDIVKSTVNAVMGPGLADVGNIATGAYQVFRHNVAKGIEEMIPLRMARDFYQAYNYATTGLTDSQGRVILPSSQISTGAILAKAVGAQPAAIRLYQEGRTSEIIIKQDIADERGKIINEAIRTGGIGGDVGRMFNAFNEKYPQARMTYSQLYKDIKDQKEAQTAGQFGMQIPKKQRAQMAYETRFAHP